MSSLTINSRSGRDRFVKAPLVAALIAASPALYAQQGSLEEVVVTAQKRAQNLQDVPISIETLSTVRERNVWASGLLRYGRVRAMLCSWRCLVSLLVPSKAVPSTSAHPVTCPARTMSRGDGPCCVPKVVTYARVC